MTQQLIPAGEVEKGDEIMGGYPVEQVVHNDDGTVSITYDTTFGEERTEVFPAPLCIGVEKK